VPVNAVQCNRLAYPHPNRDTTLSSFTPLRGAQEWQLATDLFHLTHYVSSTASQPDRVSRKSVPPHHSGSAKRNGLHLLTTMTRVIPGRYVPPHHPSSSSKLLAYLQAFLSVPQIALVAAPM